MARQEEKKEVKEVKEVPAKGRKKIMIIAGVVVASAALIGAVLIYTLNSRNAESAVEAGSDRKAEQVKKRGVPVMYPLEAFIVNISDGSDMRYLKVKVELETNLSAENVKKELDPFLAPLRDSILVLLTTKTIQDVQGLPGKNRLREEILAAANRVLPSGKISTVYFTDFVVQ
jgi:flagellar FliL protein